MSTPAEQRAALYALVPAFECKPGCTDCCGPFPWSRGEWEAQWEQRKATGRTCPYVEDGRCACYATRPLLCRLFGAVDTPALTCPHGCGPAHKLTEAQARDLMHRLEMLDAHHS